MFRFFDMLKGFHFKRGGSSTEKLENPNVKTTSLILVPPYPPESEEFLIIWDGVLGCKIWSYQPQS